MTDICESGEALVVADFAFGRRGLEDGGLGEGDGAGVSCGESSELISMLFIKKSAISKLQLP